MISPADEPNSQCDPRYAALEEVGCPIDLVTHGLGGDVSLASKPGEGTILWSTASSMPLQRADTPTTRKAHVLVGDENEVGVAHVPGGRARQQSVPPQVTGRGLVLVVDDEAMNRDIAQVMLEGLGFEVALAHDGADAVTAITTSDQYAAVLMDCHMPRLDGYAATRAIRALQGEDRHLLIIAHTASSDPDERQRCLAAGMDDFLVKPVDPALLAATLNRWQRRLVTAAQPPAEAMGVLDERQLSALHSLTPEDPSIFHRLLDSFLDSTSQALDEIHSAKVNEDHAQLEHVAHRLKGSALNIGVQHLASVCQHLEDHAARRDPMEIDPLTEQLTTEITRATLALRHVQTHGLPTSRASQPKAY